MFALAVLIVALSMALTACDHKSGTTKIEQSALAYLRSTTDGAHTDSVSCTNDHQLRVAGRSALAVRCIPHGGHLDGIETCIIFEGDRLLNGNDLVGVPVGDRMCRGQG